MNLSPDNLDVLFQALGDPTRRAILERLAIGNATVSEIAEPFEMSLPAVMEHVRKLEAAGLVVSTKTGRVRTVVLVTNRFVPIHNWLDDQRAVWEARLDRLENFALNRNREPGSSRK